MSVKEIRHNNMVLTYEQDGDKLEMKKFMPGDNRNGFEGGYRQPNFQMTVMGTNYGNQEGVNVGGSKIPHEVKLIRSDVNAEKAEFVYLHEALKLEITVHMTFIKDADVIRQYNTVKNVGEEEQVLTHISSMNIPGIGCDGELPWDDENKFRIHYCLSTWQGEAQWRTITLEQAGIYSCSVHQNTNTFQVSSIGSWSTARYAPFIMFEDIETKQIWYAQIETSSAWHFEIGHKKQVPCMTGEMYMEADGADENTSGWAKRLAPGETFETVPVAFGCTNGGLEEAVREMTKYRRNCLKPAPAWSGETPLMFNDYMNCLWANPTEELLLPLIDAVAEAGAEGFCIDAGWFGEKGKDWGYPMGDWIPSPDRFGEKGLQGIIDYIRSKGMRAGLWIEFETCCPGSAFFKNEDDCFLCRHGKRIGGDRAMLDFRNQKVRTYMHEVFDRLIDMGVTYFKNDYNQTTALGDDKYTESAADGLLEHVRALYDFIDEVLAKHPDVIIENCSGGGLRGDYGMSSHCHFQNTSDQEIYWRYPAIFQGHLANFVPEQTTIWSYPWPLLITKQPDLTELSKPEFLAEMADGEQTIFNMINGFCGNMLLSGHFDYADEYNKALVKEGCSYYKYIRQYTHRSTAVFPIGLTPINRKDFTVVGFQNEEAGKLFIAAWRINAPEQELRIPLGKYLSEIKAVKIGYPAAPKDVTFEVKEGTKELAVHFTKDVQGRFFEIDYKA